MQNNIPNLVSVVIPCYNHELYVKDCIQSVINQTYENIELIIIDDGSEDNSVEEIKKLISICNQRFVRFEFRSQSNKGLSATLNEAIHWCRGEYISCIASDDMMLPDKSATQVHYLKHNKNIVAVFGGVQLIDENNNIYGNLEGTDQTYNFKNIMLDDVALYAPTQMIRTNSIREVGGYIPDLLIEDYYMWLKLAEIGHLHCLNKYLSQYRQHPNNTSKNIHKMHEGRLKLLSLFNSSEFYDQAIKDEKWLYHLQQLNHNNENTLYNLFYVMKTKPLKTLNLGFKKIFDKIKKKLRSNLNF